MSSADRWRIEVCPVCGSGPNIAGNKYCYGRPGLEHEKTQWEWVEVVRIEATSSERQGES